MEFCQHGLSDGCNWVGLGETITNYKVSSCPFACHRLRPTLPANFFIILLSKSLFSIFGCLIFLAATEFDFLGCHFMPLSLLTNSFVMSNEHQAIVLICACIHKRTKSLLKVPLFLYQSLLKKLHNCWTF